MIGKNWKGVAGLFLILAVVGLSGCVSPITVPELNSTNWTVGPGQDYSTITACLDAINGTGDTCLINVDSQIYTINGSYYYYIQDLEGDGAIRANASNIILDCNNCVVHGPSRREHIFFDIFQHL